MKATEVKEGCQVSQRKRLWKEGCQRRKKGRKQRKEESHSNGKERSQGWKEGCKERKKAERNEGSKERKKAIVIGRKEVKVGKKDLKKIGRAHV